MGSMQARRERRQFLGFLGVVLMLALFLVVFGLAAGGKAAGPAWDFEAGYQLAPRPAPYVSVRTNLLLGDLWVAQFWLLPEAGVTLSQPAEWYGRVQLLADTPLATVGAEVKTGAEASGDALVRVFARFGW